MAKSTLREDLEKVHIRFNENRTRVSYSEINLITTDLIPFIYVSREDLEKVHIRFNENRTRVSYSENSSFHFLPSRSNGSLNDVLNAISFPYLTITARVSEMNLLAKLAISTQMKTAKYQPFVTLTARQFLYGYEDDFLTWTYKVGTTFGFYVPYKRFSMLDSILDQINSNFTVDTGLQDIDTLQRVQMYNGRPDMGVWRSDKCNAYDGTDGTFYEYSKVTARQNLSFFSNFICRNVEMVKVQETPLFSLSTVPRYSMIPELFLKDFISTLNFKSSPSDYADL
ncbi:scavenger receptor class B member 1-like [Diaphorina citri]|uniref:Scavenger receptor class B member 1 n=1 Tax=Diaphorina citri TaxID=121845 RepID=A0A3Q0JE24_DIACI|nr:scavenger receptor class B member 1-like [Diaphorina citri]